MSLSGGCNSAAALLHGLLGDSYGRVGGTAAPSVNLRGGGSHQHSHQSHHKQSLRRVPAVQCLASSGGPAAVGPDGCPPNSGHCSVATLAGTKGSSSGRRGGKQTAAALLPPPHSHQHSSTLQPPPPPSAGVFSHHGLAHGLGHHAYRHHAARVSPLPVPVSAAPGDKAEYLTVVSEPTEGDADDAEGGESSEGRAWRSRTGRARSGRRWIPRGEQVKRAVAAEAEDSSLAAAERERWRLQEHVNHNEADDGDDAVFTNNVLPLITSNLAVELAPTPDYERATGDGSRRRPPVTDDGKFKPEGTGREILLQGFNWESHKSDWYGVLGEKAAELKGAGFSLIWLPPASQSVADEGYMPVDLYNLNSRYGSEDDLRACVAKLHSVGLGVLADIVINHRCASRQDEGGVWNIFGGKMAWDQTAIVGDDPNYRGRGNPATGTLFHAAPNIDHRQEFVRADIKAWMQWLKTDIGFDGWRFDFTKGYGGEFVGEYVEHTMPLFSVGEFWDTLSYSGNCLDHNQNNHRQRTVDWINASGGRSLSFDMTTKGILHSVIGNREYWRLSDQDGKPPGVLGWWPSKTCTFLENHDTGSTQGHWRFPENGVEQGYAYILTHPGTPTVFWDHYFAPHWQPAIQKLMSLRLAQGIHCRSQVHILKADSGVYAAQIDDRVIVKIGPGDWSPNNPSWERDGSGHEWCVWVLEKKSREAMDVVLTSSFIEAPTDKGDSSSEDAIKRLFEPPQIQHDD